MLKICRARLYDPGQSADREINALIGRVGSGVGGEEFAVCLHDTDLDSANRRVAGCEQCSWPYGSGDLCRLAAIRRAQQAADRRAVVTHGQNDTAVEHLRAVGCGEFASA